MIKVSVPTSIHNILATNGRKFGYYTPDKSVVDAMLANGSFEISSVKSFGIVNYEDLYNGYWQYTYRSDPPSSNPSDYYFIIRTFDGVSSLSGLGLTACSGDSTISRYGNSSNYYDVVDPDGNKYQIWVVRNITYSTSFNNYYINFTYNWSAMPNSSVTWNLTECTHNLGSTVRKVGDTVEVVLTPSSQLKEFQSGATVTIDGTTTTFEPSADKTNITFTITLGKKVTITAEAVIATPKCSVVFYHIKGCHVVGNPENSVMRFERDTVVSITFELDEGYCWYCPTKETDGSDYNYTECELDYDDDSRFEAFYETGADTTRHKINIPKNYTTNNFTFNVVTDTSNVGVHLKATILQSEMPPFYPAEISCTNCTHNLTEPLSYEYNTPIDLVVTANDGYEMQSGTVTITTNSETGETSSLGLQISEDKKTASGAFNSGYGFTVTATALELYDATFNLTNCIHNLEKSKYTYNTPISLVLTANSGYEFTEAGTVTIITDTETGETTTVNLVISEDKKTATADFNSGYGFTVTAATTVVETPVVPIHYSITITNDGNGTAIADVLGFTVSEALEGETVTLIPSPNDGYEFDSWVVNSGGITIENNKFTMPANDVSITATFKQTSGGGDNPGGGGTNPDPDPDPDEPVPSGYKKVTFNLKNCSHNLPHEYAKYDERITIVLTADEGYEFDVYGTVVEDPEDEFLEGDTWNITDISEDKKTASISVLVLHPLTVTMIASKPIPEQLGGLTNIYKITTKQLNEITGKIYPRTSDGTIPNLSALETTGKFFINLIEFPFDIDRVVEDKVVKLGYLSTGVVVEGVPEYLYELDLGSIHVDTKYNNYYDTTGSVRLFLPYTGEVSLPIEQVVGQTVSVKYIVNLFTGQTTINIYSTLNDVLISSIMFVFGTELPFYEYRDRVFTSDLNIMGVYNGITKPYIEITRNKPYNVENQFGKPTVDYGKLADYSGYIECGNVYVTTNATVDEKALIQQILKSGVIIK
jgi:hypothetical protein